MDNYQGSGSLETPSSAVRLEAASAGAAFPARSSSLKLNEERRRSRQGLVGFEKYAYNPLFIHGNGDTAVVVDLGPKGRGFWREKAWIVSAITAAVLAVWAGSSGVSSPTLTLSALTAAGLAVALYLRRPRSSTVVGSQIRRLAVIDRANDLIYVLRDSLQAQPEDEPPIYGDEIEEIIYARRAVRAPGSKAELLGAGLFIKTYDGEVWSIVPSTLCADDLYRIAKQVSRAIRASLKQAGAGFL